ncbi:hypothetical protein JCM3766R1_005170 [Sporobolomyces carnicolor]
MAQKRFPRLTLDTASATKEQLPLDVSNFVQEAHVEFVKRTHECDKWYHKFVDQEIALKEEQSKAHPDPRKIKAIHSML